MKANPANAILMAAHYQNLNIIQDLLESVDTQSLSEFLENDGAYTIVLSVEGCQAEWYETNGSSRLKGLTKDEADNIKHQLS